MPSDRALALLEKTPDAVDDALVDEVTRALTARHGAALAPHERVVVVAQTGRDAAYLEVSIGDDARRTTFELFCEGRSGALLDGALGLLVDYVDDVLTEFFAEERGAFLPLEFARADFESHTLFVRSEHRELALEAAADAWLAAHDRDD